MVEKLCLAARDGKLPVYRAGENARVEPSALVPGVAATRGTAARTHVLRLSSYETYWSDLNRWLAVNEPHVEYRIPDPSAPFARAAEATIRSDVSVYAGGITWLDTEYDEDDSESELRTPYPRQRAQEDFILDQIRLKGIDPLHFPVPEQGKPGIKADIRQEALQKRQLFQSVRVFEKAWERLRASKQIKDKDA
jgi:hypothetical protein